MDKWNDICCVIEKYAGNNLKEDTFQNVVESIFGLLGWSHHKNEIDTKRRLRYGASRTMIPDIIIQSEGKDRFVVELKKQSIAHLEDHVLQLVSYMTRIRVSFGLIIRSNIQFFYDVPYDKKDPIKLIEIEFTKDNFEGSRLFGLLKRDSFDEEKLVDYCNEKLAMIKEEKEIEEEMSILVSPLGEKYILQLIAEDLKKKGKDNKLIEDLIHKVSISIKPTVEINKTVNITNLRKRDTVVSNSEKTENQEDKESSEIKKVKSRLPLWLSTARQNNINSQIFIRFMELLGDKDFVYKTELIRACSDIERLNGHLSSMSQFGLRNHANIFSIRRNEIRLWEPVASFAKDYYLHNYKPNQ